MPILPDGCQAITAYRLYIDQSGLLYAETLSTGKHATLAALPGTPGTGTGPAQVLPAMDTLMFVAPAEHKQVFLLVQQKGGRSRMMIL